MAIKTRPTDADVGANLDAVRPATRRADALALARVMGEVTGTEPVLWGPSMIGYGSYRYAPTSRPKEVTDWFPVGFAPRSTGLVLYGLRDRPGAAELLARLGTFTEGAGCVYAKRLADLDEGVLRELVALAFARPDDVPAV